MIEATYLSNHTNRYNETVVSSCVVTRYAVPTEYTIVLSLSSSCRSSDGVSSCRYAASYPPVATSSTTDAVFASLHPPAAEARALTTHAHLTRATQYSKQAAKYGDMSPTLIELTEHTIRQ